MNQSVKKPPVINIGVIGWLRQNLFSTWYNTILTFLGILLSVMIITALTLTGQSLGFEWTLIFIGIGLIFIIVFWLIFNKRNREV